MPGITPVILHHRMPDGQLVLCDGSRQGVLISYLPVKVRHCKFCKHFKNHECKLGNSVKPYSKACNRAVPNLREKP